tara:strand:+ start:478 stop:585 length:108 start_codon:yes stop_codon:yes gene_type:complete
VVVVKNRVVEEKIKRSRKGTGVREEEEVEGSFFIL